MEERPQFSVGYETLSGDIGVVVLVGEIDIYSAPEFKEVLVNGIEGGARKVIVDLSQVTFIDSTALGVLVSGAKRVRPRNGNLDIVCTDCLLYTSDAADDLLCVDLGGRRIIKKKKKLKR